MPLEKQRFLLNFVGGLDTKSDPKQVIPSKLLGLENGIFVSPGRIKKRNGYQALNTQALYATSVRSSTSNTLPATNDSNWPISVQTTKTLVSSLTVVAPTALPPTGPRLVVATLLWKTYRDSTYHYTDATSGTDISGVLTDSNNRIWTKIVTANFMNSDGDVYPGHHGAEIWATWYDFNVPQGTHFTFTFTNPNCVMNTLFTVYSVYNTVDGSVAVTDCFGNMASRKNAGTSAPDPNSPDGIDLIPVESPLSVSIDIQNTSSWAICAVQDGYDYSLGIPIPTSVTTFDAQNSTNTTQFSGSLNARMTGSATLGATGTGAWHNIVAAEILGGTEYTYSDSNPNPEAANISTGNAIFGFNGQLLLHDGAALNAWSGSENAWRAIRGNGSFGQTPAVKVTQLPIIKNNGFQLHPDMAVHPSGLTCVAYEDTVNSGVRYIVLDTETQAPIIFDWPIPTINNITQASTYLPKVVNFGKWICLFYSSGLSDSTYPGGTGYSLYVTALDTTNPTAGFGNTRLLHGNFPIDPSKHLYDVCTVGNRLVFVFASNSNNLIGVNSIDIALNFSVPPASWTYLTQTTTGPASNSIACFPGSVAGSVIVAWGNDTSVIFEAFDSSTLTVLNSAQNIENKVALNITGSSIPGVNDIFLVYTVAGDRPSNYLTRYCKVTGAGYTVGTPADFLRSVGLAGKAFQWDGVRYIPVVFESISQPTVFFADEAGNIVGKALAGSALGQTKGMFDTTRLIRSCITITRRGDDETDYKWIDSEVRPPPSSSLTPPSDGKVITIKNNALLPETTTNANQVNLALPERFALGAGNTGGQVRVGTITVDDTVGNPVVGLTASAGVTNVGLTFGGQTSKAILASTLHFSGGCLWMYDGAGVIEHGFHVYPEGVVVPNPGGNYVYNYIVLYEWMDIQGNLHRSAYDKSIIQAQVSPIDASSNSVTLTIPTLRLTAKQNASNSSFRRPVTCTVYRTAANGTQFHRVNQTVAATANDPTKDTISFRDTTTDAQLLENPILYTTGGILKNIPPNPPAYTMMTENRVWIIDSTDPLVLWFSKECVPGAPVEFSDSLTFNLTPRSTGNLETRDKNGAVALCRLDDKIIVFRRNSISYITGSGPDSTGSQSDFREIQLPMELGCTDPHAISTTSLGLIFKSNKGFFMLDRALTLTYIGADVEAYNAYAVTSAQPLPQSNWIIFTLANGQALLHDFLVKQWSVLTNIDAVSADVWNGVHVWLGADGVVHQETPGVFSDDGRYISILIKSAWVSLAGLQGYKRLWDFLVLGDWYSPHKLQVDIAYDFNPTVVQSNLIDFNSQVIPIQERIHAATQLCQSFQVTLTERPTNYVAGEQAANGTLIIGEGLALSGLAIEIGIAKGLFKMPATKSAG